MMECETSVGLGDRFQNASSILTRQEGQWRFDIKKAVFTNRGSLSLAALDCMLDRDMAGGLRQRPSLVKPVQDQTRVYVVAQANFLVNFMQKIRLDENIDRTEQDSVYMNMYSTQRMMTSLGTIRASLTN